MECDNLGGVMYISYSNTSYFKNCYFNKNHAQFGGGSFYLIDCTNFFFTSCSFNYSESLFGNGGVLLMYDSMNIEFTSSVFSQNRADRGGCENFFKNLFVLFFIIFFYFKVFL